MAKSDVSHCHSDSEVLPGVRRTATIYKSRDSVTESS